MKMARRLDEDEGYYLRTPDYAHISGWVVSRYLTKLGLAGLGFYTLIKLHAKRGETCPPEAESGGQKCPPEGVKNVHFSRSGGHFST
jgi:hypothetical protein